MKKSNRKIICIVGPTASGKTGWGVLIAKKFGGEIISADSRQIYQGLNIGTGKDIEEYGDVKYHLIDICKPGENFTMFDWLKKARIVIEDIFACGKVPIIVGGTGLYVQALAEGFGLEQVKSEKRIANSFSREDLEKKSLKELQKIFLQLDKPENLQLDLNNPRRIIRSIERAQNGEIISKKKPDFEVLQIAVSLPRDVLYQLIDKRVEEWFENGFFEEVAGLLNSGVDPNWLKKIGLEYRILTEFILRNPKLDCHSGLDPESNIVDSRLHGNDKKKVLNDKDFLEMKQKMKFAIHAYARRQLTWFRRFPEIIWLKDIESTEKTVAKFLKN